VNHPNEEQRVSVKQALRMFTIDAAFAGRNETRHGSISPGKEANFVLLDADLFEVPPERLRRIRVLQTWFRGRPVYQAPGTPELPQIVTGRANG
jgi:predicted amidohydrolase YtcJ